MRNTDDLNQEPFRPLGERVTKTPPPPPPAPAQKPRGDYGVVQGDDGRFRTTRDHWEPK